MKNNKMLLVVGLAVVLVIAAVVVLISSMLGGGKDKDKNAASGAGSTPASVSQPADGTAGEPAGEADQVRACVNLFNESYFISDPEGVLPYLSDDYAGEDNVYAGNGTISEINIEVLGDVSKAKDGDTCQVKVTYLDDEAGTEPQALQLELVRKDGAWKIRSYGPAA